MNPSRSLCRLAVFLWGREKGRRLMTEGEMRIYLAAGKVERAAMLDRITNEHP